MAYQDIVSLLLSEAEEKAAEILSAAEEKAQNILASAKQSVEDFVSQKNTALESEKDSVAKKAKTELVQKARLLKAQMQEGVLNDFFNEIQEKLQTASEADLQKIFVPLLASISEEKGEVVALGNTSQQALKKAVQQAGKKFSVSNDPSSSQGGFIFKGDGFTMDFSFDSFVKTEIRPKYESKIFKKLFS